MNLLPHFWTSQYFKRWQSLELPSSTLEGNRHKRPLTSLYRIQCSANFHLNHFWIKCEIFRSVQLQSESTSSFLNITIFQKMTIFRTPSSTLAWYRHMRPLTSSYRIQRLTIFIWSISGYDAYFWQHPTPKWIYFPVFEHYNISKDGNLWSPLALLWGEIDICAHWLFCTEFNAR